MPVYYSSEGNPEIWEEKPLGYLSEEEWEQAHPEVIPEITLEEAKALKLIQIDRETSNKILAGFDYAINDIVYHFSYDNFDQQNFVDTASMCLLAQSNPDSIPTTVVWNSYLSDDTLVQHELNATEFLDLYIKGAMQHKATQMSTGGQRKALVETAQTIEELEDI